MDQIKKIIHPEGWRFFVIFSIITLLSSLFSMFIFFVGCAFSGWCLYFFRDPIRVTPSNNDLVISPADGRISLIKEVVPPHEMDLGTDPLYRVSIFLNVFDVHINRSPIKGKIKRIIYYPGKFFNASLDKASEHNERNALVIEHENGQQIGVIQIAGLIARRILTFSNQGDSITTGERFGLIRFGSRVDVFLPKGVLPSVIVGQRTIAGETIIADLQANVQTLDEGIIH